MATKDEVPSSETSVSTIQIDVGSLSIRYIVDLVTEQKLDADGFPRFSDEVWEVLADGERMGFTQLPTVD